jgi:hypothetical protein
MLRQPKRKTDRDHGAGPPRPGWLRRLLGRRWSPPLKPVTNLSQLRRIAYL